MIPISAALQMVIVLTPSWEANQGMLYLAEKTQAVGTWQLQGSPIPVVVGKNGMAWGIGLHPNHHENKIYKREGDGKAPAGIFSLGPAFGLSPTFTGLRMDYLHLDENVEAVDDPLSRYYNRIVKRDQITEVDWKSCEKMAQISLYKIGVVVHHNWDSPVSGAGSAIFMHVWRNEHSGTAGCTAMSDQNMRDLLIWLDPQKKPLLVQMPTPIYQQMSQQWGFISLDSLK